MSDTTAGFARPRNLQTHRESGDFEAATVGPRLDSPYTPPMDEPNTGVDAARLVAQAPDAMIFADRSGVIRAWNTAAERVFGHPATDAIGERLDLIVPEQFREAHWAGWERAIGEGQTKYVGQSVPTRAERADGTPITVELGFAIILDDAGASIGALATARDISERWEQDRATRRRLRELEADREEQDGEGR